MSTRSSSMYDRQITIFSPEGKLYQVEYAFRAVKGANITSVGLKGKDCAVIIAQKKVPSVAQQDKLLDTSYITSLYHVTARIGGAFIGLPADCRAIAYRAREKASNFEHKNGQLIPVRYLTQKISDLNQIYTQHAYMRLQACSGMLIGIDEEMGPVLYKFDAAGWFTGQKAAAIGTKDSECVNALEKLLKKDPEGTAGGSEGAPSSEKTFLPQNLKETVERALETFQTVMGLNFKASDLEIGVVTIENPNFRTLTEDEIDQHLTNIAERD